MGLGQALTSAVSGLRVTQAALSVVSGNIANAETPGYVKKTVSQVATSSGDINIGVRLSAVNRALDTYLQNQLRTENSGGNYASTLSDYYGRLQGHFRSTGRGQCARDGVQQFHRRRTVAFDIAGFEFGALRRADRPVRQLAQHPSTA